MRGKRFCRALRLVRSGLIPAHAGKTCCASAIVTPPRAHPRACGENQEASPHRGGLPGSSPRMRGKRIWRRIRMPLRRLIPAHAGKTPSSLAGIRRCKAHPRACGENVFENAGGVVGEGSSPRMRGKRWRGLWRRLRTGLIPAHAGKTDREGQGGR